MPLTCGNEPHDCLIAQKIPAATRGVSSSLRSEGVQAEDWCKQIGI
jgi:hypothetical protein